MAERREWEKIPSALKEKKVQNTSRCAGKHNFALRDFAANCGSKPERGGLQIAFANGALS